MQKKFPLLALALLVVSAFVLGFVSRGFSGGLAQVVKYVVPAPSNLTAYSSGPTSPTYLTWTDNSNNELLFFVERSGPDTTSSFSVFSQVGTNVTSTYDSSTSSTIPGMYYYRVMASVNSSGTTRSEYSNTVSVFRGSPPPVTVAAPTNLAASSSNNLVSLFWTDNSNNETGFYIERSGPFTTSSFSVIASSGINANYFTDTSVATGTFAYRVRAYNGSILSLYSNTVSVFR
jgi:hypothetical protein